MRYFILIFLLGITLQLFAQNTAIERTKQFNLENGIAIQGYDPVSYVSINKATKGKSTISANYQGVVYHFSSEANKKQFLSNPSKYEPQYGGWCAFAMGDYGKKVEVDPETFKIIEDKLYLYYNAYFNNTLKSWNKDEKNLKAKADKNWSNIIKK
ncbi:YHS domain-containing (seleno)protein [Daejeonella sp.]|jgi:YHS domain-containing protein|uniref:YHS domain-containing (seleno)protein n=1 Tax=Daejeonella sp. TaxID=2805397 RepID=UPI0037848E2C